jgi:hypothetical protein
MNLPGFTAEASLCNVNTRYRVTVTTGESAAGQHVEPAGPFSDYAELDRSYSSLGPIFKPKPTWCFRWIPGVYHNGVLVIPPTQVLGVWNSLTRRCERY